MKISFFPHNAKSESDFASKNEENISEIRKKQTGTRFIECRNLSPEEINLLKNNNNSSDSWEKVFVKEPFNPSLVKNSSFEGIVRIGILEKGVLTDGEVQIPCGITSSHIISSDIGDYCAIHNNSYICAVITGNYVILTDNNEIYTSENAKFGNCIVKEGEDKSSIRKINLVNERGDRGVPIFSNITGEEIFLWIKYCGRKLFREKLNQMSLKTFDSTKGYYSFFDDYTVIKGTKLVKNIVTGKSCHIERATRVEEVTVNSSSNNPSFIGDNVIALRGIISGSCVVDSSSIAEDFILFPGSSLKMGAKFIHSCLGQSSNISCCEVQSSFIFPCHQQHHNNSFLIASIIMGQSNIAAGATLGSNHNGRINDCEMWAGRGFWPGLCSSVRFNSSFASYTLLSKSDFPHQLNIRFPFSLVSNNSKENCLDIIPAYWWKYNMYALFRNYFKFKDRAVGIQSMKGIELSFMAPDTAEEIITALTLLDEKRKYASHIETELHSINIKLDDGGNAEGDTVERSGRTVRILRIDKAEKAYKEMLLFYCGSVIFSFIASANGNLNLLLIGDTFKTAPGNRDKKWLNLFGKLVPETSVLDIVEAVEKGEISSWEELRDVLSKKTENYESEKLIHAAAVLRFLYCEKDINIEMLKKLKEEYLNVLKNAENAILSSRQKDFKDPVRQSFFDTYDEMTSVSGCAETDPLLIRFKSAFEEIVFNIKEL